MGGKGMKSERAGSKPWEEDTEMLQELLWLMDVGRRGCPAWPLVFFSHSSTSAASAGSIRFPHFAEGRKLPAADAVGVGTRVSDRCCLPA